MSFSKMNLSKYVECYMFLSLGFWVSFLKVDGKYLVREMVL